MSEHRVWIAQCLCPQRHCILATAGEADSARLAEELVAEPLREGIAKLLAGGTLNPWCGLCHSPAQSWTYEVGRTPFRSIAEAMPTLKGEEDKQGTARALWGDMRRSD